MIPIVELSPGVAGGYASLQEAVEAGGAKRIDNAELVQQKKRTILIVHDPSSWRDDYFQYFETEFGCKILTASNIEGRLRLANQADIIISDYRIHKILGTDFARQRPQHIPFILISNHFPDDLDLTGLNIKGKVNKGNPEDVCLLIRECIPDIDESDGIDKIDNRNRLQGKKILVVVNDSTLRKALGTMLQWEDAQVTTASNPEEVLLHHQPLSQFDLILCDGITGTDISGREFLTGAHESAPNSKLALMAYSPDGKIDLTGTPINTFLLKPIGDKSISTIVEILKLPVT